jgi:hypothetical protein
MRNRVSVSHIDGGSAGRRSTLRDSRRDLVCGVGISVKNANRAAFRRKRAGDCLADAGAAAGNNRDAIF